MKSKYLQFTFLLTLLLMLGSLLTAPVRAATTAGGTFIVDSTSDTNAKDGWLTLREAILIANGGTGPNGLNRTLDSNERAQLQGCAFTGSTNNWTISDGCGQGKLDTIHFSLAGSGVHTITVTNHSGLPTVTDPVIIDGYSQPGAHQNTLAKGNDTVLLIQLSPGVGVGDIAGLDLETNSSIIQGLIINGFRETYSQGFGIVVAGQGGNTIQGNFIGTDANGAASVLNSVGVWVTSSNNLIGGVSPAARNLISGNGGGVYVGGPGATQNKIQGNFLGTNRSGTAALSNAEGVIVDSAQQNLIGGTETGARNVISGNDEAILISASTGTVVQGNYIGLQVNGKQPLGNTLGIYISGSDNVIGGSAKHASNRIAYSGSAGITVVNLADALDNTFSRNSIYSNAMGIDLGADGVTLNDIGIPADEDIGPNNLQNSPIVMKATSAAKSIKVYMNSTINTTYTIELFSATACDLSGHGQGKTFLGAAKITTNQYGDATKSIVVSKSFKPNQAIVATATDPFGNTSEFGYCKMSK